MSYIPSKNELSFIDLVKYYNQMERLRTIKTDKDRRKLEYELRMSYTEIILDEGETVSQSRLKRSVEARRRIERWFRDSVNSTK